ncbi:MAG: RNA pyrophosphohydrolase [Terrimicrobiaceae bacterium]
MPKLRPNVAFILRNRSGEILLCERSDWPGSWQFPQGGIQKGESVDEALSREVSEELGLPPSAYRVLTRRGPYRYLFPNGLTKRGFRGQEQTYFLAELVDDSAVIDFGEPDSAEFRSARWISPTDFPIDLVPAMKADVYRSVLADLLDVHL